MDKTFWQAIVAADFAVPEGHTVAELTPELLTFLGSTDINVRDPFGYTILAHWIVRDDRYQPDELRRMRDGLLKNLNVGLGEQDTDSVFLRSFSVLALSLIDYRDNQNPFFNAEEINALIDAALVYFRDEKDLRGYTPDKGWAHSCAHTADALKFLARNTRSDAADHARILDGIFAKMTTPAPYVYIHNEDERVGLAVLDVLKRGLLAEADYLAWLDRFTAWKAAMPESETFDINTHAAYENCRNLLRSLYFQLERNPDISLPGAAFKPKLLEANLAFFSM